MIFLYGYTKEYDKLLKLKEVSIECQIDDIDNMIEFLKQYKRKLEVEYSLKHQKGDIVHLHLKDCIYDQNKNGGSDLILVSRL